MFVLGDPAIGEKRHHKSNAIMVSSYSEALELVRKGCSIRMSDGRSPPNLVSATSLEFIDEPVMRLDHLWNYTVPEAPFSLESVMEELRTHLIAQAADISLIAGEAAASAFIGFEWDCHEKAMSAESKQKVNLSQFNITRIAQAAYEGAFCPNTCDEISEDEVDELEQIITGSMVRFDRRFSSPLDREGSALQRTLLAAYYRWQISDGCFLAREELDQSATQAIGALTGMPANAVRNALSRDGISLVKSKIDYPSLLNWIVTRRNFAPLRQSEMPEERSTWRVLNHFLNLPLAEAISAARSQTAVETPGLLALEKVIIQRRLANEIPTQAELREYAKALCILPDNFILQLHRLWEAK